MEWVRRMNNIIEVAEEIIGGVIVCIGRMGRQCIELLCFCGGENS